MIDKITGVNNIVDTKKSKSTTSSKEVKISDSLQISSEAQMAADLSKVTGMVKSTPDIRAEKVQLLKESIANGTYNFDDNKVLEMVADKIAESLLRR